MSKSKHTSEGGYIALITVLIIASAVLVIGMSTSLLSVNDLQSAYAGRKNEEGLGLTESCVEDALIRLNKNAAIPATLTLPEGTCSVTINSQSGNNWDFTVTPQSQEYTKRIRVAVTRSTALSITSWLEQ